MFALFIFSVITFILVLYKEKKLKKYYFESINGHDYSEEGFAENYQYFNKTLNLCVWGKIISAVVIFSCLSFLSISL